MLEEYSEITAFHYAAYRPPLHLPILLKVFDKHDNLDLGLDVGCGTGHSAIALAQFCDKVYGIDPSLPMLDKSISHPKVSYQKFNDPILEFPDQHFDVITFAGSFYYAKSQELINELIRVSRRGVRIFVYDFEIELDEIIKILCPGFTKSKTDYNHLENFNGLDHGNLGIEKEIREHYFTQISNTNLAHLILSSKENYIACANAFGENHLYHKVFERLNFIHKERSSKVKAKIYASLYAFQA